MLFLQEIPFYCWLEYEMITVIQMLDVTNLLSEIYVVYLLSTYSALLFVLL